MGFEEFFLLELISFDILKFVILILIELVCLGIRILSVFKFLCVMFFECRYVIFNVILLMIYIVLWRLNGIGIDFEFFFFCLGNFICWLILWCKLLFMNFIIIRY